MNSENLGKTLTCGRCAASESASGRLSPRKLLDALTISGIRSAVSADQMLHRL